MNAKTYHNEGLSKLPHTLREFGERQNRLNAELKRENEALTRQVEVLSGQLGTALERLQALEAALDRVTALEEAQELNIKRFGRCAADLDRAEAEINRLKLTAKLNSNAIDRLTKRDED